MPENIYSVAGANRTHLRRHAIPITGRWWNGHTLAHGPVASTSWAGVRILAYPIEVCASGTLDRLGVVVLTGASGAKLRVGIYAATATGPGAKVAESDELTCETNGVAVTTTISVPITAGGYWAAIHTNGTACSTRSIPEDRHAFIGASNDTFSTPPTALSYETDVAFASGLPADLSTKTPLVTTSSTIPHGIRFRIS